MSDTALAAFFSEDNMQDVAPRRPDEESVGTNENRVDQPDLRPSDLPDPDTLPELRIYSRSTMFFWWPVLVTGYILAAITYFGGETLSVSNGTKILVHPNTGLGISFIVILTLIMMLTNVRLWGIYSVVGLLSLAWWDSIFRLIPQLTVYMNFGFYLTFSTLLLAIWALRFFFFFDRLGGCGPCNSPKGGGEQSYDTRGMLFAIKPEEALAKASV